MKKKILSAALICLLLCCVIAVKTTSVSALEKDVEIEPFSDFSAPYFSLEGNDNILSNCFEMIPMYDWAQNQVTVYGKKLSGNYSIQFTMESLGKGFYDCLLLFGLPTKDVTGSSGIAIGHSGEGFVNLAKSGTPYTFYAADGTTPANIAQAFSSTIGIATQRAVMFRFDKVSARQIDIYFDYAGTPNALTTKRNVIKSGVDIPEGYFCLSPILRAGEEEFSIFIDDVEIKKDGETLFNADFENGTPDYWESVGGGVNIIVPSIIESSKDFNAKSNFEFKNKAGIKYFNTGFSYTKLSDTAGFSFAFGNNNSLLFGGSSVKVYINSVLAEEINFEADSAIVRLEGDAGGLNLSLNGEDDTLEIEKTYQSVDCQGPVEFKSEQGEGKTAIKNITLKGNVTDDVLSVRMNPYVFNNANVEYQTQIITTTTKIFSESTGDPVNYSITDGADKVSLNGATIQFIGEGNVTVKAQSAINPEIFDTVTFTIGSKELTTYSLSDDFTEYNAGNFTKIDPLGRISFSNSIVFTNDYADISSGYEGARLVSNVKFESGKPVIFDLSFSPYFFNEYKGSANQQDLDISTNNIRLNTDMSFGILFGMKSKTAKISECNYLRIGSSYIEVYQKGVKQQFIGNYGTARYIEQDSPHQMRVVAKNDGTLSVYVGNAVYSINELFSQYENLDMEGYIAFTTNCYNVEPANLPIVFKGIALQGNTSVDMDNFQIVSVKLDRSNLLNAVVSDKPIQLKSSVASSPNLSAYHDVRYRITEGAENATLDGSVLVIKKGGPFTIKVSSLYDSGVYDEYTVTPKTLIIDSVIISKDKLKDLNIYSQPVILSATVNSNYSFIYELSQVEWTVISGPAELYSYYSVTTGLYLTQIKFTGAGTVKLKAASTILPDKSETVEFTVADMDNNQNGVKGCNSNVETSAVMSGILLMAGVAMLINRRKEKC